MANVGKRIRKRRKELGMTQKDLANKLGYKDQTTITKIEIGKTELALGKLSNFAKALDTTEYYLMGLDQSDDDLDFEEKPKEITGIGKRIRDRRKNLKMSQKELAEKLGYSSQSTIGKIETGENDIALSKISDFAKALKTTEAYLIGQDENDEGEEYYENPDTANVAQQMFDNPDLRVLFDAAKDAEPEDLKIVYDLLLTLKKKERGD